MLLHAAVCGHSTAALPCSGDLQLARELYEEGEWLPCARQSLRVRAAEPTNAWAELWWTASRARMKPTDASAIASLERLAALPSGDEIRCWAAYELAHVKWHQGKSSAALALLEQVFLRTHDRTLFQRSGAALWSITRRQDRLRKNLSLACQMQLRTCGPMFAGQMADDFGPSVGPFRLLSKPAEWLVAFYRTFIGPAIGARCSLEPSCSTYFLEANRRHGLLALPIGADRFVREPSVIAEGRRPVHTAGGVRFADPVSDHDWWLSRDRPSYRTTGPACSGLKPAARRATSEDKAPLDGLPAKNPKGI